MNKKNTWKKGNWYSRGYLPHFDSDKFLQFITIRLYDSLPKETLESLKKEIAKSDKSEQKNLLAKKIEQWIDNGVGSCYLQNPQIAELTEQTLLYNDSKQYNLHAWVIMPNHIHFIIEIFKEENLAKIIKNIKSYTAKKSNQILNRRGKFWFNDYFDKYIRDVNHYNRVKNYIEMNPVKAGLCKKPEEWNYSSIKTNNLTITR